jgi:dihydroorotate dehydrogenase
MMTGDKRRVTSYTLVPTRPVAHLSLYASIVRPILFRLPAESAHELSLHSLSVVLGSKTARRMFSRRYQREPFGKLRRFSLEFRNPIGLAAGFDKNGTAAQALAAFGFGFIEVGTVTSGPQPGNPRPRIFRLPLDRALINRAGFNNCGAEQLTENIQRGRPDCVLGVNIGKSRSATIEDAVADYLESFEAVYDVADYIAINVSSPNTPNLRALQRPKLLADLLVNLQECSNELAQRKSLPQSKPLLLKIAPDLTEAEVESIVEVAMRSKIAGLIATNTTVRRDGLQTSPAEVKACGEGGLSGAPLRRRSNEVIGLVHRLTHGALPILGVGGVFTAEDAWEKICAGASLIQLYTGFIYEGPGVARRINEGLAAIMKREGFRSLDEAVGCSAT